MKHDWELLSGSLSPKLAACLPATTQTGEASVEGCHVAARDPSRPDTPAPHPGRTPWCLWAPHVFSGAARSILCPAVPRKVSLGDLALWLYKGNGPVGDPGESRGGKKEGPQAFPTPAPHLLCSLALAVSLYTRGLGGGLHRFLPLPLQALGTGRRGSGRCVGSGELLTSGPCPQALPASPWGQFCSLVERCPSTLSAGWGAGSTDFHMLG